MKGGSVGHNAWGFTLIEMVIFISVVSIGVVGVLSVFGVGVRSSADPMVQKQMLLIAEGTLNEVMQKSFSNTSLDSTGCTAATAPSCNSNSWTDRPNYNDVDDYNGFSQTGIRQIDGTTSVSGLSSYSVSITVTPTALGSVSSADSKKIVVTVSNGSQSISLSGYRTNYE